jgi:uncharacterized protein YecT (DUF1311 family)
MNRAIAGLIAAIALGWAGQARAECADPAPDFDAGFCQPKTYTDADQSLNQVYRDLEARLGPEEQNALKRDELEWLRQRDARCTIVKADRTYVDFGCAAKAIGERLSKLQARLAAMPASRVLPTATAKGSGLHGCALFGGSSGGICQDFPAWTKGQWQPAAGIGSIHVLVVGGGGGGGASIERGIGGTGGASGKVVVASVRIEGGAVAIEVGARGVGGVGFRHPGGDGGASAFGDTTAKGGGGGQPFAGGGAPLGDGGGNGGGGGGGGNYQDGFRAGTGGSGGTGGTAGTKGNAGTDAQNPVEGTEGGVGSKFPLLDFTHIMISAGAGGTGGAFGHDARGYGGGGGGGGGGVLIKRGGGDAQSGAGGPVPHSGAPVAGGGGGAGYGAGGGGGGNFIPGARGGDGAAGLVYVEW